MKAIITRQNKDGTFDSCGTNNRMITREYKTATNVLRYGIPAIWLTQKVKIDIYYFNIYKEVPDRSFLFKKGETIVELRG